MLTILVNRSPAVNISPSTSDSMPRTPSVDEGATGSAVDVDAVFTALSRLLGRQVVRDLACETHDLPTNREPEKC